MRVGWDRSGWVLVGWGTILYYWREEGRVGNTDLERDLRGYDIPARAGARPVSQPPRCITDRLDYSTVTVGFGRMGWALLARPRARERREQSCAERGGG